MKRVQYDVDLLEVLQYDASFTRVVIHIPTFKARCHPHVGHEVASKICQPKVLNMDDDVASNLPGQVENVDDDVASKLRQVGVDDDVAGPGCNLSTSIARHVILWYHLTQESWVYIMVDDVGK